jgi:hypothetical protein
MGVAVAVGLGVNVGLGVYVMVGVGVSVANRLDISETPEQERMASANMAIKRPILPTKCRCFMVPPEKNRVQLKA